MLVCLIVGTNIAIFLSVAFPRLQVPWKHLVRLLNFVVEFHSSFTGEKTVEGGEDTGEGRIHRRARFRSMHQPHRLRVAAA